MMPNNFIYLINFELWVLHSSSFSLDWQYFCVTEIQS